MEPQKLSDPARVDDEEKSLVAARARSKAAWRRLWLGITSHDPADLARLLLVVGGLAVLGWIIWASWAALLPFQIGVILAYLMSPVVNRLEQRMPRWAAIVLVLAGFLTFLMAAILFVVPPLAGQLSGLLQLLPSTDQIEIWLTALNNYLETLPEEMQVFVDEGIAEALSSLRNNIMGYIRSTIDLMISTILGIVNTFTFLIGFVVIPFWLFFVLNDQKRAVQALDRLLPAWLRADFWAVLRIANRIIGSYFRGQLILGGIIFGAVFLGLNFLSLIGVEGIRFTLLLAVFAGFMELIPIIGPILGAVPAILVGLFHSWETALAIGLMFLIIQQIEGNVLVPRVVGDSVNIHPALVMMLVVILIPLGLVWMIVAVPLVAIIRDIYRYVYGRFSKPPRPAGLLPNEPLPAEAGPPVEPVVVTEAPDRPVGRVT